jgi:hypothetical protein
MVKNVRTVVLIVAAIAILGIGCRYFVYRMADRAVQSAAAGGAFEKLLGVTKATLGATVARGDVKLKPGEERRDGRLEFYQKNPERMQQDQKYFDTWSTALTIADTAQKPGNQMTRSWVSSAMLSWIAPSQRIDSWGHYFCVQSTQEYAAVISPGPQAEKPLACSTVELSEKQLTGLRQGRLNPWNSGTLVLIVKSPK